MKHKLYCKFCGKQAIEVEHFGGKKRVKVCIECAVTAFNVCFKCFNLLEDENKNKSHRLRKKTC